MPIALTVPALALALLALAHLAGTLADAVGLLAAATLVPALGLLGHRARPAASQVTGDGTPA